MKKIVLIIFSFLLLLSCNNEKKESKQQEYKIGIILPLTGSAAVWGQNAKMGIDLALSELKKQGIKVKLFVEDSKSDTKTAVSALEKLISTNNVQVVIGDIASSSVLAMAPIAEKNKVVLLSPGASNPDISKAGDYIFRNWQSDALEGKIDADFVVNKLKKYKIGILYVNNAYGKGLEKSFVKRLEELEHKALIITSFEQGSQDMRTQIQKIKDKNAEVLYMPGYPKEMAIALKQLKQLDFTPQVLSTQAFDDPEIIKIAGDAANGVIYSVPKPPDTTKTIVRNFVNNYKKRYGVKPGVCSDTGYDALKIIIWAMKDKNALSGEQIKNALYNMPVFDGAAGSTKFDKNGDVIKEFEFRVINNKMVKLYGNKK